MKSIYKAMSIVAVFLVAQAALAQDRKPLPPDEAGKYIVSAKAGIVGIIDAQDVGFVK